MKKIKALFAKHPEETEIFLTSDGYTFFKHHLAFGHASTLENKEVGVISREQAEAHKDEDETTSTAEVDVTSTEEATKATEEAVKAVEQATTATTEEATTATTEEATTATTEEATTATTEEATTATTEEKKVEQKASTGSTKPTAKPVAKK